VRRGFPGAERLVRLFDVWDCRKLWLFVLPKVSNEAHSQAKGEAKNKGVGGGGVGMRVKRE
jgi:hypothetical protein